MMARRKCTATADPSLPEPLAALPCVRKHGEIWPSGPAAFPNGGVGKFQRWHRVRSLTWIYILGEFRERAFFPTVFFCFGFDEQAGLERTSDGYAGRPEPLPCRRVSERCGLLRRGIPYRTLENLGEAGGIDRPTEWNRIERWPTD